MSEESVDKRAQVEEFVARMDARDFDALAEMPVHPDMQLRSVISKADGGVFYGVQGLREWGEAVDSTFDDFRVELVEYHEVDDEQALVVTGNSGKAKASGVPVHMFSYLACTWRNGLMWRSEAFTERREALEAMGASEHR